MHKRMIFLVCVLLLSFCFVGANDKKSEGASEKDITRIMKMVFYYHYTKHEMTKEVMRKTMHNFLVEELDSQSLFFLQEDYDKWMERSALIGKAYGVAVGSGAEWKFIFGIQEEFLSRYQKVTQLVSEEIENLSEIDQSLVFNKDAKKRGLPKTLEESASWLRFYVNYNIAYMMQKKKYTFEESKAKLKEDRKRISEKYFKKTKFDTVRNFLNAFTAAIDPHTTYYSPLDYQDFTDDMRLSFEGIGARLLRDEVSGTTMITDVIPNGPAFRSGALLKYDEVLGVREADAAKFTNVVGMELTDVVHLIKGPANTTVVLQVRRTENDVVRVLEISITRGKVESTDEGASITYERIVDKSGEGSYLIGVIYLPSFYRDFDGFSNGNKSARSSAADVERLLLEAQANKVDGIVLNLLGNSGGSLTDAIKIASLFVNKSPVVITRDNKEKESVRLDTETSVVYEGPLVVAINKNSASASEIVAGALKDYQRALIVGEERTFGKGTVQEIYSLGKAQSQGDVGMLKITINQFFTAGGKSTQWNGVESDIRYPAFSDVMDIGEKEYPEALPFQKIKSYVDMEQAKSKWLPLTDKMKQELQKRSEARTRINKNFNYILQESQKILEKKNEKDLLKVASFFEREEDEDHTEIDFSVAMIEQASRADQNRMVKYLEDINVFPKKNFGIDESPASYISECLNALLKREDLNEVMPREVKYASSVKARALVDEIKTLQLKENQTAESTVRVQKLRKELIVEYYPIFRRPYQNSLFVKESTYVVADLIRLERQETAVNKR